MVRLVAILCLCAALSAETLVTDFASDLPGGDADTRVVLRLEGLGALSAKSKALGGALALVLERRAGAWVPAQCRAIAEAYQKNWSEVDPAALKWEGDVLSGDIVFRLAMIPERIDRKKPPEYWKAEADAFTVHVEARRDAAQSAAWQIDPVPSMPPWRKQNPRFGGALVTGTYAATLAGATSKGVLAGGIAAAPLPGRFGVEGNCRISAAPGGGAAILCRLAPRRVAAPEGARAVKTWAAPADWRAVRGLRLVVASERRRDDATVTLGLREADGSWWTCAGAALLLGREATFEVLFSDFRRAGFDEDYSLDLGAIAGISLGVDNPRGVGDVAFTVRRIELLPAVPEKPATIPRIAIGSEAVAINGCDSVPRGLFGFHDVNPPMKPGEAGAEDPLAYLRRLDPGFLRWIDHVGWGGKAKTDAELAEARAKRQAEAKDKPADARLLRAQAAGAVDGIIQCHTTDLWARPAWMGKGIDAFLPEIEVFYRNLAANAWTPGDDGNLMRRLEVWNEPFMWGRHINLGARAPGPDISDDTQHGYLPGKVGAEAWARIFASAVKGAKSSNPHVLLGGPCSPGYHEDDWQSFTNYTARILDQCQGQLDFLTEHHYQGEPDAYAASYLVATAYFDTRHQRRIPIWNTECNDLVDAPTKGDDGKTPPEVEKAVEQNLAHYNLVDIVSDVLLARDVAKGRAMHALWNGFCRNPGETNVYTFLAPLRGAVLATTPVDPNLLVLATAPSEGRIAVMVYNAGGRTRRADFAVPAGFQVEEGWRLGFQNGSTLTKATPPAGTAIVLDLPPRQGECWMLSKAGWKPVGTQVWTSHFAQGTFITVAPGTPATLPVAWRGAGAAGAKEAFLRVVTQDVQRGEAVVEIGGKAFPLPWSSANECAHRVQDIAIDPALLAAPGGLIFRCADPASANGFRLLCAAVYVRR